MGTAKLMTPLFYDGNYNVEKKRMRAVLEREVSNGAVSYRLWRSDGKPDLEYPRAANDAYILHVEVNDHLVPLRMTDYWYEDYWAMPRNLPRGHEFFIGYYQTQRAIHHHVAFIHTDQSCFLSTHLFDQGYRIFLHFKSDTVTEVGRGVNPALPVRIIRENMNLEAPLLAGLLGKLTE